MQWRSEFEYQSIVGKFGWDRADLAEQAISVMVVYLVGKMGNVRALWLDPVDLSRCLADREMGFVRRETQPINDQHTQPMQSLGSFLRNKGTVCEVGKVQHTIAEDIALPMLEGQGENLYAKEG